jgi:type I restriction enzyme S subunit
MNNWKRKTLHEVADVKLSNVDKKFFIDEIKVRLCNYTDVYKNAFINSEKAKSFMVASCKQNELDNFRLKVGQVVITKDSETRDDIGVSTYISESFEDVVLGYHTSLITPNPELLSGKYLHYWFNTKQAKVYFENNAGGSGQRCTLPIDIIKAILLHLPPIDLQEQIATLFYNIDSKIELNNRINAELEGMAKTLYDYWFVQFDFPVYKEDGSQSGVEGYKTSGGKMVWNEELKREIPEGWEAKELNKFSDTASGGTPLSTKKEYYENGNIPWINSGELNNPFIIEGKKFITKLGLENSSAKIFKANTLLVALYGATAGKVSLLQIDACTNQAVCAIIPKSKVYINYLKFAFDDLYNHMINLSTGSARDNLSQDLVGDLKFIISNEDLLIKFNENVNPIIEKITINLRENQKLTELRDWLLPMLMNGQVKVKDVEEQLVQTN